MKQILLTKKFHIAALVLALTLVMTGCGFQMGGSAVSDDSYEELFPDKAATLGKKYKISNLAYVFSLEKYGSMEVHVDTSEGHKFKLDSEYGGFSIQNSDGEELLHAYCLLGDGSASPEDVYAAITAPLNQLKTVNNRDFFYSKDGSYRHLYSYMADCGLDCGIILETDRDEDVFRLVAFRGKALEGASSDPYSYKGSASGLDDPDPLTTDPASNSEDSDPASDLENASNGEVGSTDTTAGSLDPEIETFLASLGTDYNKINWGVRYSIDPETPYLIVSIAPYTHYDTNHLLVGFTNLYDQDICFSGSLNALSRDDTIIGDTFVYTGAIGTANTVFADIYCGEAIPDGRIRWEDCIIDTELYDHYVPWEGDYALSADADAGSFTIDYSIYSANGEELKPGGITFCLVDANGNILLSSYDYVIDIIAADEKYEGSISIYGDIEQIRPSVKDVAMFVQSTN